MDSFAFEPAERGADGDLTGVDDRPLHPHIIGDGVQDRHRLRRFERQVKPRHPTRMGADRFAVRGEPAGAGSDPGEHGAQVVGVDVTGQPEPFRADASPPARRLTRAGVVVVQRLGDTRKLVRLLADPELGDTEHPTMRRFSTP